MRLKKYKVFICVFMLVCAYYFFGVGDYLYSKSFDDEFDYPMNVDIKPIVHDILSGKRPVVTPINYYPYRFLSNSGKCNTIEKLDLFIIVKSAMHNFGHRSAVRQTFGQENLIPGRIIKILFFLGIDYNLKSETQKRIDEEMAQFKDIIQIDFHDNYYNNTIKTMMSFRWLYQHCSTADFYLFTDDDMYISLNNLLDYVHDQTALKEAERGDSNIVSTIRDDRDVYIFAGYVFKSAPLRFKTSKWRVSLEEYPWNKWPPYVTAGAFVVNNRAMKILYVGSLFVKHFKFDDIYLGIVAKKVGIKPMHSHQFHFYKKKYSKDDYADVIASHGYDDHDELIRVWTEQNRVV
ncbi:beta-1,3-galactosyltransferase brn-like isoform 1-T1 [Aphomia sociella]